MTLQERLTALATAIGADMKGKAPSVHAHANATPSADGDGERVKFRLVLR